MMETVEEGDTVEFTEENDGISADETGDGYHLKKKMEE